MVALIILISVDIKAKILVKFLINYLNCALGLKIIKETILMLNFNSIIKYNYKF